MLSVGCDYGKQKFDIPKKAGDASKFSKETATVYITLDYTNDNHQNYQSFKLAIYDIDFQYKNKPMLYSLYHENPNDSLDFLNTIDVDISSLSVKQYILLDKFIVPSGEIEAVKLRVSGTKSEITIDNHNIILIDAFLNNYKMATELTPTHRLLPTDVIYETPVALIDGQTYVMNITVDKNLTVRKQKIKDIENTENKIVDDDNIYALFTPAIQITLLDTFPINVIVAGESTISAKNNYLILDNKQFTLNMDDLDSRFNNSNVAYTDLLEKTVFYRFEAILGAVEEGGIVRANKVDVYDDEVLYNTSVNQEKAVVGNGEKGDFNSYLSLDFNWNVPLRLEKFLNIAIADEDKTEEAVTWHFGDGNTIACVEKVSFHLPDKGIDHCKKQVISGITLPLSTTGDGNYTIHLTREGQFSENETIDNVPVFEIAEDRTQVFDRSIDFYRALKKYAEANYLIISLDGIGRVDDYFYINDTLKVILAAPQVAFDSSRTEAIGDAYHDENRIEHSLGDEDEKSIIYHQKSGLSQGELTAIALTAVGSAALLGTVMYLSIKKVRNSKSVDLNPKKSVNPQQGSEVISSRLSVIPKKFSLQASTTPKIKASDIDKNIGPLVVEIVDTAQRFLHNNQNLKVGIGIAANAGKPFGGHGKDTHKIHSTGSKKNSHKAGADINIGFKEEHLSGGGQEESIIASARLALAQKGIPEEAVVTQLFSHKDSPGTPAWGLKNSNGDLLQGGNYKKYTLQELAEGKMGEPYIHHAEMYVTSISGKPKQADLLFAYSPNYTANRGPDTSTGLTQVLDFRQSINKANNLTEEDKENIETLQKDVYRGILREILRKDLNLDAVCLPIFGSNIYSKQHVGRKSYDTELSQFIIDETQDWFKAVLKEDEFKNKFNDKAFLFTSPDGQEMNDVADYTKKEYAYNLYMKANNSNLNPEDQKYWKGRYNDYEQEEIKYRKTKDPSINPTNVKNTILADWENVKKQRVKYLDSNFSSQKPIYQQTPNPNIQTKRPKITTKTGHSRFIYRVKK